MKRSETKPEGETAAQLISKRIAELGDWRGVTLGRIRTLIHEADPDIFEEWKWMGTPVWSRDGAESNVSVFELRAAARLDSCRPSRDETRRKRA